MLQTIFSLLFILKNLKKAIFQTLMAKTRCQSKQKDGTEVWYNASCYTDEINGH